MEDENRQPLQGPKAGKQFRDAIQSHYLTGDLVRRKSQQSRDQSKVIQLSGTEAPEALEST